MRDLEKPVSKFEKLLPAFSQELRLALRYIRSDASSSLTKSRIVLEKLLIEIYTVEMGQGPRKPLLGDMLADNQFSRKIERRILARMHSVRDMGNLGPHGESVEPNDAARVLEDLCEVMEWYLRHYTEEVADAPNHRTAGETPTNDEEKVQSPEELLREILRAGRVAEAPPDLDQAIQKGLAAVGRKLQEIATAVRSGLTLNAVSTGLTMDQVFDVVHEAVGHGAGIYNHSAAGRLGCGRIYHRAAAGLTALVLTSPAASGAIPQGASLAIDLLARIVKAEPTVSPENGDEVAWELRFAFDSLSFVPLFDSVTSVVASLATTNRATAPIALCELLRQVLERGRSLPHLHATAYLLQHTARVLLRDSVATRLLGSGCQSLRQILEEQPRVTRQSTQHLVNALTRCLVQICQNIEAGLNEPPPEPELRPRRRWWPFGN